MLKLIENTNIKYEKTQDFNNFMAKLTSITFEMRKAGLFDRAIALEVLVKQFVQKSEKIYNTYTKQVGIVKEKT
jgi:hypothetical protein